MYGSLKRGFGNHPVIEKGTFLSEAITTEKMWYMLSLGGFPGVVKLPPSFVDTLGYNIYGELYEVNDETLVGLDMLEGNGSFYTRELVALDTGDTAWMYVLVSRYSIASGLRNEENGTDDRVSKDESSGVMEWIK